MSQAAQNMKAYRAECRQAGHSMLLVVDVSQNVSRAAFSAQTVLLDDLSNAAPAGALLRSTPETNADAR